MGRLRFEVSVPDAALSSVSAKLAEAKRDSAALQRSIRTQCDEADRRTRCDEVLERVEVSEKNEFLAGLSKKNTGRHTEKRKHLRGRPHQR